MAPDDTVQRALWARLDPRTLHDLIQLRVDVFVVEQECPYPELDGRDVEPATEHLWTTDAAGPTAYLRVLTESNGNARIGRVGRLCIGVNSSVGRAAAAARQRGPWNEVGFETTAKTYILNDRP